MDSKLKTHVDQLKKLLTQDQLKMEIIEVDNDKKNKKLIDFLNSHKYGTWNFKRQQFDSSGRMIAEIDMDLCTKNSDGSWSILMYIINRIKFN